MHPRPYAGPMGNSGNDAYLALSTEGSWIDRIRARLPYSFESIEVLGTSSEERRNRVKRYVLSGPVLQEGSLSAERHNFWRRGHVFYMIGKLIANTLVVLKPDPESVIRARWRRVDSGAVRWSKVD